MTLHPFIVQVKEKVVKLGAGEAGGKEVVVVVVGYRRGISHRKRNRIWLCFLEAPLPGNACSSLYQNPITWARTPAPRSGGLDCGLHF